MKRAGKVVHIVDIFDIIRLPVEIKWPFNMDRSIMYNDDGLGPILGLRP